MIDRRGWRRIGAGVACVPALVVLAAVTPVRALADTSVTCSSVALVTAINAANAASGGTLDLAAGCTYTYNTVDNTTDLPGTATPVITTPITINGNGDTITRGAAASTAFRIFDVGTGGSLTLNNTTVSNASTLGNGAILDQGGLALTGDTITGTTGCGVYQTPSAAGFTATNTTFSSNSQEGILNQGNGLDTFVSGTVSNNGGIGVESNGPITVNGGSVSGNLDGLDTTHMPTSLITVTNATLSGNDNLQVDSSGTTTVTGSTISGSSGIAVAAVSGVTMNTDTVSGFTLDGIITGPLLGPTSLTNVSLTTASASTDAIQAENGAVTITDSTITRTGGVPGATGIDTGGNSQPIQVTRTTETGFGNGMVTGSATTIDASTFSAGFNGLITNSDATITDSTFSGFQDAAMQLRAGADTITGTTVDSNGNSGILATGSTTVALSRSTITSSGAAVSGATSITASTIAGNSLFGVTGPTTVTDSILSANGANCSGTVTDGGDNVNFPATDATCPATFKQGDPKLDSLRSNGGPTQTMALLDGSVAAGSTPVGSTGCTAPDTDQRGVPRLQNNQPCDAGAFELDSTSTIVMPSAISLTAGQPLSLAGLVTPFSAIPGSPSGTLSIFNGTTLIATVTLTDGHASDGPLTLPVGTYTMVASFPGARGFLASTSAAVTVVISPPVPTTGAAQGLPAPLAPALLVLGGLGLIGVSRRQRRR